MTQSITIALPSELKVALDDVTHREGVTADDLVQRALTEHLFLRQFRHLRDRMMAQMPNQTTPTDQDVFDQVS